MGTARVTGEVGGPQCRHRPGCQTALQAAHTRPPPTLSSSHTTPQEGAKEASPEAAKRAEEPDVKDSVKSRVVSGSQTS